MRNGFSTLITRPGEEVAEDRLEREAEDQGGDGAGREQRRDVELREASARRVTKAVTR